MIDLRHGSNLDVLPTLPDASVDAIVTDPPYELGFMGKTWDASGIAYNVALWRECLRVLKPGGHLLAFSGSRTYHRMTCAIEDAGFEVRDQIMWIYGSGFPKSLDVSKAIDKAAPRVGMFDAFAAHFAAQLKASGKTQKEVAALFPSKTGGITGCVWNWSNGANVPTKVQWDILRPLLLLSDEWSALIDRVEAEREVVGQQSGTLLAVAPGQDNDRSTTMLDITAPATAAAQQWQGWGTALKPAHEPICVARKPLIGTVAANVLAHGTGAINVDASRVAGGRWPANLIHDGSEEVTEQFPVANDNSAARFFYCAKASKRDRDAGLEGFEESRRSAMGYERGLGEAGEGMFKDRNPLKRNIHPTVKPTDLMRYLCRLVTQPGGVILDPFMGSGSTGKAAVLEGFQFIGIDMTAEYVAIADARIKHVMQAANDNEPQPDLLTGII